MKQENKNKNRLLKAGILAMLLGMSGGQAWAAAYTVRGGEIPEGIGSAIAISSADAAAVVTSSGYGTADTEKGTDSIAIGQLAFASGSWHTVVGANAKAYGWSSVVLGERSLSSGSGNIAIGNWAQIGSFVGDPETPNGSSFKNSIVMGNKTYLHGRSGTGNVILGTQNSAINDDTDWAIGSNDAADVSYVTVVGSDNSLKSYSLSVDNGSLEGVTVVGSKNVSLAYDKDNTTGKLSDGTVSPSFVTVVGYTNRVSTKNQVAIGVQNDLYGTNAIGIGGSNTVDGLFAMAIGTENTVNHPGVVVGSDNSQAIGRLNKVQYGQSALAYGYENAVYSSDSIATGINNQIGTAAVGKTNMEASQYSNVFGQENTVSGSNSNVFGYRNVVSGSADGELTSILAVGYNNEAETANGVAVGLNNILDNSGSKETTVAIGYNNVAKADRAIAIGGGNATDRQYASGDYSIAIGYGNQAQGTRGTAIGYTNDTGNDENSVAIGLYNSAQGKWAVSIGSGSTGSKKQTASGVASIAIGKANTASGDYATAIGNQNTAETGNYAVAMGFGNTSSALNAAAVGYGNTVNTGATNAAAFGVSNTVNANATYAASVGYKNTAGATNAVAVGSSNTSSAATAAAVGYGNTVNTGAANAAAFGVSNEVAKNAANAAAFGVSNAVAENATNAAALGVSNTASKAGATAVGYNNKANTGENAVAVGSTNTSSAAGAAAVGFSNTVNSQYASAIGASNNATGNNSIAYGYKNTTKSANAVALGAYNSASGSNAISIGSGTSETKMQTASGDNAIAIGSASTVSAGNSMALGGGNTVSTQNSVALGYGATISKTGADSAVALGYNAQVSALNGEALGANSKAQGQNSVALGAGSETTVNQSNVVSVGTANATRKVVNVTYGTTNHDAATWGQIAKLKEDGQSDVVLDASGSNGVTLYTNDDSVITTIKLKKGEIKSGDGGVVSGGDIYNYIENYNFSGIVDYDTDYRASRDHWLSTDFDLNITEKGKDSTAYGYGANAKGAESTAIGTYAVADGAASVAIGSDSVASGGNVSFGHKATDTDPSTGAAYGKALTRKVTNVSAGSESGDVAVWDQIAKANQTIDGTNKTIMANDGKTVLATIKTYDPNKSDDENKNSYTTFENITNIVEENTIVDYDKDYKNTGKHWLSTDFDQEFTKKGENSTAYGYNANAQGDNSVAIGAGSIAAEADTFAVGSSDSKRRIVNVAEATKAGEATVYEQIAAKNQTLRGDNNKLMANDGTTVLATIATADPNAPVKNGDSYITENYFHTNIETAVEENSIVDFDKTAKDTEDDSGKHWLSTDFGKSFDTKGKDSTAYGYGANAQGDNSVAIGSGSIATEANTFAVGSVGNERQIVNVAYGDSKYDAAAYGQILHKSPAGTSYVVNKDYNTVELKANDGTTLATIDVQFPEYNPEEVADPFVIRSDGNHWIDVKWNNQEGSTVVRGENSVALGYQANAQGNNSVALGYGSIATEANTFSVGSTENTRKIVNVANGTENTDAATYGQLADAQLQENGSYKVYEADDDGVVTVLTNDGDVAFKIAGGSGGSGTSIVDYDKNYGSVDGDHWLSTDFGNKANVEHGDDSTAYGYGANAKGDQSVALGKDAVAEGAGSIAIGEGSSATGTSSIALGEGASVTGSNSVAIGDGSVAAGANEVSFGTSDSKRKLTNVAEGTTSGDVAVYDQITAKGQTISGAKTTGTDAEKTNVIRDNAGNVLVTIATADADSTEVDKQGNSYITEKYFYKNVNKTVIDAVEDYTIVDFDKEYKTTGKHYLSTDFDLEIPDSQKGRDSTAYGYGANAQGNNSVALGSGSIAKNDNEVSFGNDNLQRKLTNVASGEANTDAANVGQLLKGGTYNAETGTITFQNNEDGDVFTITGINNPDDSEILVKNQTVSLKTTTGADAQKTNVLRAKDGSILATFEKGSVTSGDTGFVAGGDVWKSIAAKDQTITGAKNQIMANDGTTVLATIAAATNPTDQTTSKDSFTTKEYVDTVITTHTGTTLAEDQHISFTDTAEGSEMQSNVIRDVDGKTLVTIDKGAVEANNKNLVDGGTVFDAIAAKDQKINGTNNVIKANNGSTLVTIETANSTAIDKEGNKYITEKYYYDTINNIVEENSIVDYDPTAKDTEDDSGKHWLSTDFGKSFDTKGKDSTAYGYGANAQGDNSVAIGSGSIATEANTFSVGSVGNERQIVNVAYGDSKYDAAAYGQILQKSPEGTSYVVDKDHNTVKLLANDGTVLTTIDVQFPEYDPEEAVDPFIQRSDDNHWIDVKWNNKDGATVVRGENSVALGYQANAQGDNSVAIGSGSVATEADTFSVGAEGSERKIVNVAAGEANTDAANVGQLVKSDSYKASGGKVTILNNEGDEVFTITNLGDGGASIVDYDENYGTTDGDHWLSTDFGKTGVEHGDDSTAYGYGANAQGDGSVAIGKDAVAQGEGSVAIGEGSIATGDNEVSFGTPDNKRKLTNVEAGENLGDVAVYDQITASGQTVSLKTTTGADSEKTNVIRDNAGNILATFEKGEVTEDNPGFVAGGDVYSAIAAKDQKINGTNNVIKANDGSTLVTIETANSTAIDKEGNKYITEKYYYETINNIVEENSIVDYDPAYGTTDGDHWLSTDFGKADVEHGDDSTAYGYGANAKGDESVAIGKDAVAEGKGSVAIGEGSIATGDNEVSFGTEENKRKLTNVAAGENLGDVAVYDQIAAKGQTLSGSQPNLMANDGTTILATLKVTDPTKPEEEQDGDAFLTKNYYDQSVKNIINANTIVDFDKDYKTSEKHWLSTDFDLAIDDATKGTDSTAYGYGAYVSGANSVALGANSIATGEDVVSFGHTAEDTNPATGEAYGTALNRKLTNVAAGEATTDAANVGQIAAHGQDLNINGLKTTEYLYDENGDLIAKISVQGLPDPDDPTSGFSIVDFSKNEHWLSTDFDITGVKHGVESTAFGYKAEAAGERATAIGYGNKAEADHSTAVGYGNKATGEHSTAVGDENKTGGDKSAAYGYHNEASGDNSTAIGTYSKAEGDNSVAMGNGAEAKADNSMAFGTGSVADESGTVSFGHKDADGNWEDGYRITNIADGKDAHDAATVGQMNEKITKIYEDIGNRTKYFTYDEDQPSIVIGDPDKNKAEGKNTTSIGFETEAKGEGATAIGDASKATGDHSTALGYNSKANSNHATALGDRNDITGEYSTGVGAKNTVNGQHSIAAGCDNTVTGDYSVALGHNNTVNGNNAYVIGGNSKAEEGGIVIGKDGAAGKDGIVIGNNSKAAEGSTAIGGNSVATDKDEISFGHAKGDTAPDGTTYDSDLNRKLTHVADGTGEHDAVTKGQLDQVGNRVTEVEKKVDGFDGRIADVETSTGRGIAGASALAALHPLEFDPDDKASFAVGYGHFKSSDALALGAFYRPNESVLFSVGGVLGNGEDQFNAGISFALGRDDDRTHPMGRVEMSRRIQNLQQENAGLNDRIDRLERFIAQMVQNGQKQQQEEAAQAIPTV